jgi:hypothetical protein
MRYLLAARLRTGLTRRAVRATKGRLSDGRNRLLGIIAGSEFLLIGCSSGLAPGAVTLRYCRIVAFQSSGAKFIVVDELGSILPYCMVTLFSGQFSL